MDDSEPHKPYISGPCFAQQDRSSIKYLARDGDKDLSFYDIVKFTSLEELTIVLHDDMNNTDDSPYHGVWRMEDTGIDLVDPEDVQSLRWIRRYVNAPAPLHFS
jgi:hypothetical protein